MEYQNKEAEMQYKDLRGRFLGMLIGCAIGEIVGRESLAYKSPDDEAEEKLLAELSGSKSASSVSSFKAGKLAELLNRTCKTFSDPQKADGLPNCWSNQLFFRIAPIAFVSEVQGLDVSSTVSMGIQSLVKAHTDTFAVLPPVECILLLKSILQKKPEIPPVWPRLEIALKTNADAEPIWSDRMVVNDYKWAQKDPIHKLSPVSGLYMLKFVIQKVLSLSNGKEWKGMPIWKVAMDRLIKEGRILDKRDRPTAGALSGAFLGAYFGVGAINPFYRKLLADQDVYFKMGQSWFDNLWASSMKVEADDKKTVSKGSSSHFRPYLAHKDKDELKAVFNALAVRNDALRNKYPGGVAAYHHKHRPRANRNICISCFMGGDIDSSIDDLMLCGLMPPDDFVCFNATLGTICADAEEIEGEARDLGVSWLKGRYHDGYLWVRYDEGKGLRRKVQG